MKHQCSISDNLVLVCSFSTRYTFLIKQDEISLHITNSSPGASLQLPNNFNRLWITHTQRRRVEEKDIYPSKKPTTKQQDIPKSLLTQWSMNTRTTNRSAREDHNVGCFKVFGGERQNVTGIDGGHRYLAAKLPYLKTVISHLIRATML